MARSFEEGERAMRAGDFPDLTKLAQIQMVPSRAFALKRPLPLRVETPALDARQTVEENATRG
jgi:hypothetical protein